MQTWQRSTAASRARIKTGRRINELRGRLSEEPITGDELDAIHTYEVAIELARVERMCGCRSEPRCGCQMRIWE